MYQVHESESVGSSRITPCWLSDKLGIFLAFLEDGLDVRLQSIDSADKGMVSISTAGFDAIDCVVEQCFPVTDIHELFRGRLRRERPETGTAAASEDDMVRRHREDYREKCDK